MGSESLLRNIIDSNLVTWSLVSPIFLYGVKVIGSVTFLGILKLIISSKKGLIRRLPVLVGVSPSLHLILTDDLRVDPYCRSFLRCCSTLLLMFWPFVGFLPVG
ncbi:uncharacterized protein DS421_1g32380 [Arachis hypogaea]|nr:uncharacterized protein DS421_1g32380 [Arachis hypogaea]